jgi:hypothetical protein
MLEILRTRHLAGLYNEALFMTILQGIGGIIMLVRLILKISRNDGMQGCLQPVTVGVREWRRSSLCHQ